MNEVEAVARAWNRWWNSVSTGANYKHMQTAFEAGFSAALDAARVVGKDTPNDQDH